MEAAMAQVEVRDLLIWTKHIHGDAAQKARLDALSAGSSVRLSVAGHTGEWQKVKAAALRPLGDAKSHWGAQYESKRGKLVELNVEVAEDWRDATEADRNAAWEAFKLLTRAGWRSDDTASSSIDRADLHER
jgi:hypothetical protein